MDIFVLYKGDLDSSLSGFLNRFMNIIDYDT